jgi:hypothetical protein
MKPTPLFLLSFVLFVSSWCAGGSNPFSTGKAGERGKVLEFGEGLFYAEPDVRPSGRE